MLIVVMTQATGGRCAAADTVDNVYVANAMATLRDTRHPDGGAVYDMTKALSHSIRVEDLRLVEKTGGKSDYKT